MEHVTEIFQIAFAVEIGRDLVGVGRETEVARPAQGLPQDGEILERNAVNGMRAAPGDVLFRIADHQIVWALLDVAERDLSQVAIGAKATIRPRALASRTFTGTVALIYPHLNARTRTARIRVEVPNPDEVLRPEMYVDAEIEIGTPDPVLAVPESAILDSGARQAVLIDVRYTEVMATSIGVNDLDLPRLSGVTTPVHGIMVPN